MGKHLTSTQLKPHRLCDCCGEKYDRRVARVVDESFPHKSMNHFVCPRCFSDIESWNNKGFMGWYIKKRLMWTPEIIMKYEYGKMSEEVPKKIAEEFTSVQPMPSVDFIELGKEIRQMFDIDDSNL